MHFPVAAGNLDLCFFGQQKGLGFEWIYLCRSFVYNVQILYLHLIYVALIAAWNKILDILMGLYWHLLILLWDWVNAAWQLKATWHLKREEMLIWLIFSFGTKTSYGLLQCRSVPYFVATNYSDLIFVLSDTVLPTYYNSIKDYSDIVPHLARLCRNIYLSSCLDKLIFSINIADNWGKSSHFTGMF